MADSIIKGVAEEIGELAKDTGKEVIRQGAETGKDFFKAMAGIADVKPLSHEEYQKKVKKQTEEDQKKLAAMRKALGRQMQPAAQEGELSVFEQKKREEVWKKQRQVELAKQKQMQALPVTKPRPKRGSLFSFKKRKEAHIEMGKTPGQ